MEVIRVHLNWKEKREIISRRIKTRLLWYFLLLSQLFVVIYGFKILATQGPQVLILSIVYVFAIYSLENWVKYIMWLSFFMFMFPSLLVFMLSPILGIIFITIFLVPLIIYLKLLKVIKKEEKRLSEQIVNKQVAANNNLRQ